MLIWDSFIIATPDIPPEGENLCKSILRRVAPQILTTSCKTFLNLGREERYLPFQSSIIRWVPANFILPLVEQNSFFIPPVFNNSFQPHNTFLIIKTKIFYFARKKLKNFSLFDIILKTFFFK